MKWAKRLLVVAACGIASTAYAGLKIGQTSTVTAKVHSFVCGEDGCYLMISTAKQPDLQTICASAKQCGEWAEQVGEVGRELQIGRRAKLSLRAEMFEPAGEAMWHVTKIRWSKDKKLLSR